MGDGVSDRFKGWLAKELEYLHQRASCAVPEDFPEGAKWDWEVHFLDSYLDFVRLCSLFFLSDYFSYNFFFLLSLMKNLKDTFLPI